MWQAEQNSGGLLAMNGFMNVRRCGSGFERQELVVRRTRAPGSRCRQLVQRRVLDREVALAHRAADVRDRVARRAAEPGLRLGRVDLLLDRRVEPAVEEHRVVVAAGAPLATACVPTTSCMYSIDLRYHWLLNDEKWCAEEFHCS